MINIIIIIIISRNFADLYLRKPSRCVNPANGDHFKRSQKGERLSCHIPVQQFVQVDPTVKHGEKTYQTEKCADTRCQQFSFDLFAFFVQEIDQCSIASFDSCKDRIDSKKKKGEKEENRPKPAWIHWREGLRNGDENELRPGSGQLADRSSHNVRNVTKNGEDQKAGQERTATVAQADDKSVAQQRRVLFVVGREGDERAESDAEREKDLRSRRHPHLHVGNARPVALAVQPEVIFDATECTRQGCTTDEQRHQNEVRKYYKQLIRKSSLGTNPSV